MSSLKRSEEGQIEAVSLKDLKRIDEEARKLRMSLILIGGYAVRAYTTPRSWRFTKDIDFITTRTELVALHGVFELLGHGFEQREFGVRGSIHARSTREEAVHYSSIS